MSESRKIVIKCALDPASTLTVEGPDEAGAATVEVFDPEDVVTLDRAGLEKLHAFLGKLLT